MGGFYLTNLLLAAMVEARRPNTRIVCVASLAHAFCTFLGFNESDLNCEQRKYSPFTAYAESKLLNILFTVELARRLKAMGAKHVTAYTLHPGSIFTSINRHAPRIVNLFIRRVISPIFLKVRTVSIGGPQTRHVCTHKMHDACLLPVKIHNTQTIAQGAATQVYAALAPELSSQDVSGAYLNNCAPSKPIPMAVDPQRALRVWEWTVQSIRAKGGKLDDRALMG